MKKDFQAPIIILVTASLIGCISTADIKPESNIPISDEHLTAAENASRSSAIPQATPLELAPPNYEETDLFSVVVTDVPVDEVLFALARDAGRNIDIHPDIEGKVTLSAIDQTLEQVLTRITQQVAIRFVVDGDVIRVQPDNPYLKSYSINYLNVSRLSRSEVTIATEVSSTGGSSVGESGGEPNVSNTTIQNESINEYWDTLLDNIKAILRGGDSRMNMDSIAVSETDGVDTTSIIANRESGVISVKATQKQHKIVRDYIAKIQEHSQRQVLIEATIAEVTLNDNYQAGVDWQRLASAGDTGFSFSQNLLSGNLGTAPFFNLTYNNTTGTNWSSTVRLLDQFGKAKVLSSPKLMVLNNQTALLKVVENRIYFTTQIEVEEDDDGNDSFLVETEVNSVPVGFVMSVTPQISEQGMVTLNARPTISRITGFVEDPGPSILAGLATGGGPTVQNLVPEIQVREIESVLKVSSGDIAVIGGLMQDTVDDTNDGVPALSRVPLLGRLFKFENSLRNKTELVIFIRPVVIDHASVNADLSSYKQFVEDGGSAEIAVVDKSSLYTNQDVFDPRLSDEETLSQIENY